jgi:hypothetical protein
MSFIHGRLALTAFIYVLIISLWGFWRFFRKQGVSPAYWGALAVGEVLLLAQALLGGYLWIIGLRPGRDIHLLYGVIVPIMIPGAYLYTKGRDGRPEILIYAAATIIDVGLLMRAIVTAVPGV